MSSVARPSTPPAKRAWGPIGWYKNPWRKPRVLESITWLYLAWSILPVTIAIVFSFNQGRSRSSWQGFSLRWWRPVQVCSGTSSCDRHLRASAWRLPARWPCRRDAFVGLDRWRGSPQGHFNAHGLLVPESSRPRAVLPSRTSSFVPPERSGSSEGRHARIAYAVIVSSAAADDRTRARGGDGPRRLPTVIKRVLLRC
jgi:hypothetical protein